MKNYLHHQVSRFLHHFHLVGHPVLNTDIGIFRREYVRTNLNSFLEFDQDYVIVINNHSEGGNQSEGRQGHYHRIP